MANEAETRVGLRTRAHVVCAGNELCRDDGVGIRVGRVLRSLPLPEWTAMHLYQEIGWDVIEILTTPDRVVVVDATSLGKPPGTCTVTRLDALGATHEGALGCHGLGLPALIELAAALRPERRELGATLVGIEAERLDGFSTELSPSVRAALPRAVEAVLDELGLTELWTDEARALAAEIGQLGLGIDQAHAG